MTWYLVGSNLPRQSVPGMRRSLEITTLVDPVDNVQNMRSHSSILFEVVCRGAVPWRILVLQSFPTFTLMVYFLWPSLTFPPLPQHNESQDPHGTYTYHVYRVTSEKLELCLTCVYPMQLKAPEYKENIREIRVLYSIILCVRRTEPMQGCCWKRSSTQNKKQENWPTTQKYTVGPCPHRPSAS